MTTTRVTIPPVFYEDHVARDLPAGVVIKETKSSVTVEMDAEEMAELISDARHYATSYAAFGSEYAGIITSAKATLRALVKQGVVTHREAQGLR